MRRRRRRLIEVEVSDDLLVPCVRDASYERLRSDDLVLLSIGAQGELITSRIDTANVLWEIIGDSGMPVHRMPRPGGSIWKVDTLGRDWLFVTSSRRPRFCEALVVSNSGRVLANFPLGTGAFAQSDPQARIWVGYDEEGTLGPDHLGDVGLRCLTPEGETLFEYNNYARAHALPEIEDCYHINVASEHDVWVQYRSEQSGILHLRDMEVERVYPYNSTVHRFAVEGEDLLIVERWEGRRALRVESLRRNMRSGGVTPVDTSGAPVPWDYALARGSTLVLVDPASGRVSRLTIEDVRAALSS